MQTNSKNSKENNGAVSALNIEAKIDYVMRKPITKDQF